MENIMYPYFGDYSVADSYPLMGSPVPLVVILMIYLFIVKYAGPKFMKDRKPFSLKWIIVCYNTCQIIACTLIVERATFHEFSFKNTWKCIINHRDYEQKVNFYFWQWFILVVRLAELVETVFFVLRKKQNQVSNLHVYHHVTTIFFLWTFFKYNGGIMEVFIGVSNSLVHVIMYSYYLLTIFKVCPKFLKMFKPILTSIQLIQFVLILGQSVAAVLPGCDQSKLFYLIIAHIVLLFVLFSIFFKKNYTNQKIKHKK